MTNTKKLTRILSLDGGGIRGIIPAQILVALEKKLQKKTNKPEARIADYFDLIAGTSTGGILTCVYLTPEKPGSSKPRFKAEDAVDLYIENGHQIFSVSWFQKIRSVSGLFNEMYPSSGIESVLHKYFGDLQLKDLIRPCLVSSYDVDNSKANFFTQHDAQKDGKNYYVRDVARATSAAPTYFEVASVNSLNAKSKVLPLIDGGVFANNPAMCAYAEAQVWNFRKNEDPITNTEDLLILSLGNGGNTQMHYQYEKVKDWGIIEWIKPLINIMMSGVEQTVDYQLKQLFKAVKRENQYVRIEPGIYGANREMDDASTKNLEALKDAGIKASEDEQINAKLDAVADLLIKNA